MKYIESPYNDAYLNMALEEYVFESLPASESYFMLWQNKNAVVVGKYQNTACEINGDFVKEQGIQVVRRLSGGGAMYQDMGNLNFTFVVDQNDAKSLDFKLFTKPVVEALAKLGIKAETGDRNDILIDGKKFSGNSQYNKNGRTMHHGTLLFNSDLNVIKDALNVKAEKIESKGIKSVRSRVTNIIDYAPKNITLADFKRCLVEQMFANGNFDKYELNDKDKEKIQAIAKEKYSTWAWIYGNSPAYSLVREKRFPFGSVNVSLNGAKGKISDISFSGDFFGNGNIEDLCQMLRGLNLREEDIENAIRDDIANHYIKGMTGKALAALICL